MPAVFADTFWIALLNANDPDQERVAAFDLSSTRPRLVTTQEVLTEFLAYFSGRSALFRRKAAAAQDLFEFVSAICEYLFVLQDRYDRFIKRKQLPKRKAEADCTST